MTARKERNRIPGHRRLLALSGLIRWGGMQATVFLLLCVFLAASGKKVAGGSAGPFAAGHASGTAEARAPESSLDRRLDAVFLRGDRVPGLLGRDAEGIRVSIFRAGVLQAIPFQIDAYDAHGNLVYTGGRKAAEDPDPRFGEHDLILFRARDLGPRAPDTLLEGHDAVVWEVHVTDPVDDSQGWAYITFSGTPPPLSPTRYVRYVLEEGEVDDVHTPYYTIHYPWGAYYSDRMVLRPSGEGEGIDFLDRLKTRGTFALFFSLFKIQANEERMTTRVVGYRDGPIRLVRRLHYWADLGLGLRSPKFEADIFYYDTFMNAPITTHIPVRLDLFFSKAYGRIGTDYNHKAYGMIFKNSNNPDGTVIDGRMSPQEKSLDLAMDEWRLVTGSQGTFFRGRLPQNELTAQVKATLHYVDDITLEDPPESEPGQVGHVYDRLDVLRVRPGTYETDVKFLIPPEYRPGDEMLYLEWEEHPLRVEVRPVGDGPDPGPAP